jgi:hypothetical protein
MRHEEASNHSWCLLVREVLQSRMRRSDTLAQTKVIENVAENVGPILRKCGHLCLPDHQQLAPVVSLAVCRFVFSRHVQVPASLRSAGRQRQGPLHKLAAMEAKLQHILRALAVSPETFDRAEDAIQLLPRAGG